MQTTDLTRTGIYQIVQNMINGTGHKGFVFLKIVLVFILSFSVDS